MAGNGRGLRLRDGLDGQTNGWLRLTWDHEADGHQQQHCDGRARGADPARNPCLKNGFPSRRRRSTDRRGDVPVKAWLGLGLRQFPGGGRMGIAERAQLDEAVPAGRTLAKMLADPGGFNRVQ